MLLVSMQSKSQVVLHKKKKEERVKIKKYFNFKSDKFTKIFVKQGPRGD